MGKYLTSIMKVLPAVQAKQISLLLDELKANGEIRDLSEYEKELKNLTKLINAGSPSPLFRQVRSLVNYLCSSDAHNTMLQIAKGDVEAIFSQIDEIGQRVQDQHSLIMNSISDIEKGLNEQEDLIKKLEILTSKDNEFTSIIINSFSQTADQRLNRSNPDAELLFFNNRTGQLLSEKVLPDAYVSPHGHKLMLSTSNEPKILPLSARLLTDSGTYATDLNVDAYSDIKNLIDGTKGTFWTRTVYLDTVVESVNTIVEFDLGFGRDINYCILEGAAEESFSVSEMWGIGADGFKRDLLSRFANTSSDSLLEEDEDFSSNSISVEGWRRIDFEQFFAKKVIIKFAHSSYKEVDFFHKDNVDYYDLLEDSDSEFTNTTIAPLTNQILISADLAQACGVPKDNVTHISKIAYKLSLDNIWFGNGLYNTSSIYVSKPTEIVNPGIVSIKATEANVGAFSSGANAGSVEYEIVRQRTLTSGVETDYFSCPLLNQIRVIRERLTLFRHEDNALVSDCGCLRFCPRVIIPNDGVDGTYSSLNLVSVYKNGEPMELGDGVDEYMISFSQDSGGDLEWYNYLPDGWNDFSSWNLPAQKLWIKVKNPLSTDVFTVDYRIRTSTKDELDIYNDLDDNQCIVYMNSSRTVYIGEDSKLCFVPNPVSATITSKLSTQITLRQNSSYSSLSPEVCEYMLLMAPFE
jgi:hypothetical protein